MDTRKIIYIVAKSNGYEWLHFFFIYEWLHFLAEQIHLQARIYEFLVGGGLVFKKVLKN